jgi:hypothetical protein
MESVMRAHEIYRAMMGLLMTIGLFAMLPADWQWERTFPGITSWVLGRNGEVYGYSHYQLSLPSGTPHQQVWCINPDGSDRWMKGAFYQDNYWHAPVFFLSAPPSEVDDCSEMLARLGLHAPAITCDPIMNNVHVLLGAYPPVYDRSPQPYRGEIVYAILSSNGELICLRTIMPRAEQFLFAYGIYSCNDEIYLVYTGHPPAWVKGFLADCQTNDVNDWFGGIICSTLMPNRTKWQGQFIGRSLKLLNRHDPNYHDEIPHCLPPMGAADVDQSGNIVMLFYPITAVCSFNNYSLDFDKKDRVIIYIDAAGEVKWSRKITAVGEQAGRQAPYHPYRVWIRLGTSYGFMAEMVNYQGTRTAVINCFSKSNGVLIRSEKWAAEDLFGIAISGDRCYVGLVRTTCESCAGSLCTEIWEVSPTTRPRRIACHPGRGLAIALTGGYVGVLFHQLCNNTQGIKIQLWDISGTAYWSTTKCFVSPIPSNAVPTTGELQFQKTRLIGNRYRLDVGARVLYDVDGRLLPRDRSSVLAMGQWELVDER